MAKLTSIVIITYNQLEYTRRCLASIRNFTGVPYELIVVDNGSTDGTAEYLHSQEDIRYILNRENKGFAKGCNQGIKLAAGDYVLFLNNDTLVTTGWLESLILRMENDYTIGAAGSKLLYPFTNIVQHAGMVFYDQDGSAAPFHIYYKAWDGFAGVNKTRQYQAVTGACLMVRKELFQQVGGFDEIYLNSHEDIDLCLRIRSAGGKVIYCPDSLVYHYEGVSEGRFDNAPRNEQMFRRKWHGKIRADYQEYYKQDGVKSTHYGNGKQPLLSMVMVTLNELEDTKHCIEDIFSDTDTPFELIVVGNGPSDETRQYLTKSEGIKYVLLNEKRSFEDAYHEGLRYALGKPYLVVRRAESEFDK